MHSPRASSACCSCPGDTPLLDPAEVESLLAIPRAVSIVPDRHGTGTNALVLSPPDAIAPSFGPGSLKRHVAAAEAAGVPSAVEKIPTLMLDVDTGDDLSALTAALAERRGQAPATRDALRRAGAPARSAARAGLSEPVAGPAPECGPKPERGASLRRAILVAA